MEENRVVDRSCGVNTAFYSHQMYVYVLSLEKIQEARFARAPAGALRSVFSPHVLCIRTDWLRRGSVLLDHRGKLLRQLLLMEL